MSPLVSLIYGNRGREGRGLRVSPLSLRSFPKDKDGWGDGNKYHGLTRNEDYDTRRWWTGLSTSGDPKNGDRRNFSLGLEQRLNDGRSGIGGTTGESVYIRIPC